jgi:hypothetical protein
MINFSTWCKENGGNALPDEKLEIDPCFVYVVE